LARGPFGGVPGVHGRQGVGRAREVPVLPRRRPLGPQAAEPASLVGNGARLDGSVPQAPGPQRGALVPEPVIKTVTRDTLGGAGLGFLLVLVLPRHGSVASAFVDPFP